MSRLLYVVGSPRQERSISTTAANAFLAGFVAANPSATIDVLDTWAEDLPQLDRAAFEAKYAGLSGQERSAEQEAAWNRLKALSDRFRAADKLLFSVPMWNFAIPYRLKQLIDLVSHKDLLFTFDERGLNGLLTQSKAMVIYARGIGYDGDSGFPSSVWDHQKPFMELWLKFIGVPKVETFIVEKTLFGEDREGYMRQATDLGRAF